MRVNMTKKILPYLKSQTSCALGTLFMFTETQYSN